MRIVGNLPFLELLAIPLLFIVQGIFLVEPKPLLAADSAIQIGRHQQPAATPTSAPRPGVPQSAPLDPTLLYNNLLVPNLPPQSEEASHHATGGSSVSPEVTNLANGGVLNYANTPKPQACITFDDLSKWASHVYADGRIQGSVWKDRYAGWNSFAVDDGGFYRASNVTVGYDQTVGNRVSAKIASTQPYAAGFISPPIPVKQGDSIKVRVHYLVINPNIGRAAYDWASLGIQPNLGQTTVRYMNGYTHGKWATLENAVVAEGDQVVVRLQGHSPAPQNSAVHFDDVEMLINDVPLQNCEF